MNSKPIFHLPAATITLGLAVLLSFPLPAQPMPKENVVEIPAIGDGLCVSNAFQTNMVIQRDKPVAIWGWADAGKSVTVSFAGDSATATAAADRSWKVTLPAKPANATPGTMTVSDGSATLTLANILIGDVWILGGQSNMEFSISEVNDGAIEIASANYPEIRLLTLPQGKGFDSVASFERLHEYSSWSSRHFRKGDWDICTPETVKEFSAIGYVFGRRIHTASRVPIGLIDSSIGGTTVETWTPEEVIKAVPGKETQAVMKEWAEKIAAFDPQADLKSQIASYEARKAKLEAEGKPLPKDSKPPTELRPGPVADKNRPGFCYAGVIRPLEGLSACGILFHQGFNNCFSGSDGAKMYGQVFPGMVTAWRAAFADPKLPFCILSLCTADKPQTGENFTLSTCDIGAMIREAQYQTFKNFRKAGDATIGYASTFDFRKSWYHPQIKVPAGERAAKWAMATRYQLLGKDADSFWLPPSIVKSEIKDGSIELTFDTNIATRDDSADGLFGFGIAGEDKVFHPAQVSYLVTGMNAKNQPINNRKVLVLSSPMVEKPVHYRHAWARNPMTNLTNDRQIPIPTVRSDHWPMENLCGIPEGIFADNPRGRANLVRKAAMLADSKRQVAAAKQEITTLEEPYLKDQEAFDKEIAKQLERLKASPAK